MNQNDVFNHFNRLWTDTTDADSFPNHRPKLAHYTNLSTIEAILKNDEIWMSHPYFMNDIEEMKAGMSECNEAFFFSLNVMSACKTKERHSLLMNYFIQLKQRFEAEHENDVYIFCMSKHTDDDGKLSMWRGYGANGTGAALVIDTTVLNINQFSPLTLAKVHYPNRAQRKQWIQGKLDEFCRLLCEVEVANDLLCIAAHVLFERFKLFSLFTKHAGFIEEEEWRLVYLKERDTDNRLASSLSYHIGPTGIQPKLKLKVKPEYGIGGIGQRLADIVDSIILGPSVATPLSRSSFSRMLQAHGKHELSEKVKASTTPFRDNR